jgi:hypothetical protein
MLKGRTLIDWSGPAVAGALLMAVVWAVVELGPVAAGRWFGW